ncbi:MAG: hypothetical protein COA78_35065 [Blastopirellula sp.]|nr:MAG: hypothetical protein COA78_35065 [Blastopirellula sp.]
MNRKSLVLSVAIWTLVFGSNAFGQDKDVDTIRSLLEQVAALMQAKDLAPLDEIYASGRGVHIIEGAGVNHGWEDYRDHHLVPELQAFENFQYRIFAIEPQVRDNIAFTAFRYELSADTSSGHLEIEGRGTVVLEKFGSQWKIVHSHTSGRPKAN